MLQADNKKPAASDNSTAGKANQTDGAIVPTAANPSKTPGTLLLVLIDALNTAALRAWCASPSDFCRGTIRAKAKAPVRSNTFSEAVAIPTEKRDFVSSKFLGLVRLHLPRTVLGGMGLPARMAARLRTCLKHPAHPTRVQTQTVALVTPEGAKTMTATPVASASARTPIILPTTGTAHALNFEAVNTTTSEQQAFALLQAASDATMAALYLRRGNVPAAARKARQLIAALRVLEVQA